LTIAGSGSRWAMPGCLIESDAADREKSEAQTPKR
jgi:hypothetical protein